MRACKITRKGSACMRHEGDPSGGDPASKVSKVSEALAIAYRIPFLLSKSISLHRECLCVRTKRNGTIQSPRTFLQETKHLSSGCTPPTPTTKAGAVSHCTPHQHRTDLLYRECGLYKNDGASKYCSGEQCRRTHTTNTTKTAKYTFFWCWLRLNL